MYNAWEMQRWVAEIILFPLFIQLPFYTLAHTHTHIHPYMDCCFCRTWRLSVGTILLNRVLHRSTVLCSYRENRKSRIFNVTSLFHVMQSMCLFVFQIRDRVMLCYVLVIRSFFSLFRCTKFSMHLLGILLNLVCYFCNKKKWRQIAKPILHAFCRSAHQLYPYYISMIVILLDESQNLDALTNII